MRWAIVVVALVGCYEPTIETCTITCDPQSTSTTCPGDLVCGDDFHCHAPGEATTCTFALTFAIESSEMQGGTSILGTVDDDLVLSCMEDECSVDVSGGTVVVVTAASPEAGMGEEVFTSLTGACEARNTCTLAMDRAHTVNASFLEGRRLTIEYDGDGVGQVISDPEGIDCSSPTDDTGCTAVFAANETIQLTATPETPSAFDGWTTPSGECDVIGADDCTVSPGMEQADVKATFSVDRLLVSVLGFNSQQSLDKVDVSVGDAGIPLEPCGTPAPCEYLFAPGTMPLLQLIAQPGGSGRQFTQWFGQCEGSQNPICSFPLDSDAVVAAVFEEPIVVTLNVNEGGVLQVSPEPLAGPSTCGPGLQTQCELKFLRGTAVQITHSAARFARWETTACSPADPACTFVANNSVTVRASYFPPTVSVTFPEDEGPVEIAGSTLEVGNMGANCTFNGDDDCVVQAHYGDPILIKTTGPSFLGFLNCPDTATINPVECNFMIEDDVVVGAHFKLPGPL